MLASLLPLLYLYLALRLAALACRTARSYSSTAGSDVAKRRVKMGKRMAHRGGRDTTPENTMVAFENSAKYADSIELDVWLTKDKQVVVFHDKELTRMCGDATKGEVSKLNYLELPAVVKSASQGFDQGASNPAVPAKVRIPLLSQVLDMATNDPKHKHLTFLIEFKQNSRELACCVAKMLRERNFVAENRVVWFSLDHATNLLLANVDHEIPRSPSVRVIATCVFAHMAGLLDLMPLPYQAFGIISISAHETVMGYFKNPQRHIVLQKLPLSARQALANFVVRIVGDPTLFESLRDRGLETWVLNVNTQAELEAAAAMGCESFITDRPEWLTRSLNMEPNF